MKEAIVALVVASVTVPIDDSMDDKGFVYVPASCAAKEPCRLHVAPHGCLQSFGEIGEISSSTPATTNGPIRITSSSYTRKPMLLE